MTRIARFDMLESTNDKAKDPRFVHADVVIAEAQSAGRGQRGNSWDSKTGENLTFSMVLEPLFLPAEEQFLLLQVVALGIADMLRHFEIAPQIKWTNDLYVGDKKIAGVLIENDICGANLARSIVGVGLNVNQTVFAEWVPNPTSMSIESGQSFDRDQVLTVMCECILSRYAQLEDGQVEGLQSDYRALLYRLDAPYRYILPSGEEFKGVIRGVKTGGELCIEHPDGVIREYLFKEVGFLI